jgi:3-isopropylmalate/(R)-2-methylmalate dehydratase small subunit
MNMHVQGRAWIFGDNIDTDLIVPGQYLASPLEETVKHAFEAIDPDFAKEVKPGDVIVAGSNFGCGSSRENAPQVIKHLGVGCILAESFARIFFRNAIAIGLPTLTINSISGKIKRLDMIDISLENGEVYLAARGEKFMADPLPQKMYEIIEAGGIDGLLKNIAKR